MIILKIPLSNQKINKKQQCMNSKLILIHTVVQIIIIFHLFTKTIITYKC